MVSIATAGMYGGNIHTESSYPVAVGIGGGGGGVQRRKPTVVVTGIETKKKKDHININMIGITEE